VIKHVEEWEYVFVFRLLRSFVLTKLNGFCMCLVSKKEKL